MCTVRNYPHPTRGGNTEDFRLYFRFRDRVYAVTERHGQALCAEVTVHPFFGTWLTGVPVSEHICRIAALVVYRYGLRERVEAPCCDVIVTEDGSLKFTRWTGRGKPGDIHLPLFFVELVLNCLLVFGLEYLLWQFAGRWLEAVFRVSPDVRVWLAVSVTVCLLMAFLIAIEALANERPWSAVRVGERLIQTVGLCTLPYLIGMVMESPVIAVLLVVGLVLSLLFCRCMVLPLRTEPEGARRKRRFRVPAVCRMHGPWTRLRMAILTAHCLFATLCVLFLLALPVSALLPLPGWTTEWNLTDTAGAAAEKSDGEIEAYHRYACQYLDEKKWRKLSPEDKLGVMQAIADYECRIVLGAPTVQLLLNGDMQENILGAYINQVDKKNGVIYINENYLETGRAKNVLSTVLHEVRHAWQHRVAEMLDVLAAHADKEDLALVDLLREADFRENILNYNHSEDSMEEYLQQPMEKDARNWADTRYRQYYKSYITWDFNLY